MSVLTLKVDEVMRTLSAESSNPFVVHDKEVDIVRFAINSGFADIVLDGQVALRVMYQRPGETEVRAQTLTYYDTDGLHNYYDWQLAQSDLAKNGSLMVALCILDISGGEVSEWHTTPCAVMVLSTIHTDDSDEGDDTITPTVKERVAVLESMIQRVASGAPIVVASTSEMTDTAQIYVLSTDGMWYYHNGTAWTAGGEYGAVSTDTTLTQSGMPADAKAVGDALESLDIETDATLSIEGKPADAKAVGDAIESFLDNSMPSIVKTTIIALFKNAVYVAPNLATNIKKLEKWANGLPIISDSGDWTSGVPYTLNRIAHEGATNQSGEIGASTRYDRTDYGYCKGADYLYIPNEYNGDWVGAWFYDDDKNYIAPKIAVGTYAAVPENATYFVFYKDRAIFDTVANDIIPFDASDFEVGWNRGVPYSGLTLFPNQGLTFATGIVKNNKNWSRTYYVNCEGVEYLKIPPAELNTSSDAVLYNWFYDSNKAPISRFAVSKTNDNYIMVPENAKYFILNFTTACMEDIVEKGIIPYMTEDVEQ